MGKALIPARSTAAAPGLLLAAVLGVAANGAQAQSATAFGMYKSSLPPAISFALPQTANTRLQRALQEDFSKEFPVSQAVFETEQIEELRKLVLSGGSAIRQPDPVFSVPRLKGLGDRDSVDLSGGNWMARYLERGYPVLAAADLTRQLGATGFDNLKQILRDRSINRFRVATFDLKKLNAAKWNDKFINLCQQRAGICGPARSSGWVKEDDVATLVLSIEQDGQDGTIILTERGGNISGYSLTKDGAELIRPLDGGSVVLTPSVTEDRNADDVMTPPAVTDTPAGVLTLYTPENGLFPDSITREEDCPNPPKPAVVELIVGYTPSAELEAKKEGYDIESLIHTARAIANLSFENSDIDGKLKSSGIFRFDYKEKGDFKKDLAEISASGALRDLWLRRRSAKADVAVLVVHDAKKDNCGLSQVIGAKAESAQAVVNWQCVTDRYSFVHEIAHLAGAWHDRKTVGDKYNILPSYASGYITEGSTPVATIMAYRTACPKNCARALLWANPFLKTKDGQALGTTSKNFDACIWRKRLPIMAKFGDQLK